MDRTNSSITARGNMDNYINSQVLISDNMLLRDKVQSHRLHEPTSIESHTDPITGNDVPYTDNHPFIIDGIVTVYFESEATRNTYLNMPLNHPVARLNNQISEDDDRGG